MKTLFIFFSLAFYALSLSANAIVEERIEKSDSEIQKTQVSSSSFKRQLLRERLERKNEDLIKRQIETLRLRQVKINKKTRHTL